MALGMSPGKASAYGQGAVAGDVDPDPSVGISPGEGPSDNNQTLSKIGNFVKGLVSGTTPTNQKTVPSSQNFNQLTSSQKANLAKKGYTISKSGNTVYSKTTPSAREFAENQFAGIDPDVAFRGAVAGINPVTGTMFSGATKGSALDQLTNTMMTPQRDRQNTSRTDRYKAQSDLALSGLLTAEQREINRQESLFNLDLDGDGNIFSSTGDDGTVYGMSNKAIYDPSITDPAYRGIPSRYAKGSQTTINNLPISGSYQGQKTSEDRMLANEIMSYVMPGAGIVRGVNWAKGKLAPKTETEPVANKGMTDNQFTNFIGGLNFSTDDEIPFSNMTPTEKQNFRNLPKSEFPVTTIKPDDLATSSNFANFIDKDPYGNPMYSNNPIVGYQADGRTPIYADDPNANQVPYMNVYP